jgi:tetraacyldisaccharide 4'-kinase
VLNKAPDFWYEYNYPLSLILKIPSSLVGLATLLRRCFFKKKRIDFPSAGIGSLALGGAGKTTITLSLAEELRKKGKKVGIVHSGYGGNMVGLFSPDDKISVLRELSDEVILYVKNGFPVYANKNRKKASDLISNIVDYVLLDDFFSALVEPKTKIISFTKESLGNLLVQPFGPLREPLISLLWADIVLLEDKIKNSYEEKKIKKYAKKIYYFSTYIEGILHCNGRELKEESKEKIKGLRAICVSSIAIPSRLEKTAEKLGVKIYEHIKFRDHAPITLPYLKDAVEKIKSKKADIILTTEKDFWKILSLCEKIRCNIFGIKIRAKIQDELKNEITL